MTLIIVYVAVLLGLDVALWVVGTLVESSFPGFGLPLFLALFFVNVWLAWIVAVRLTASDGDRAAAS